MRHFYALVRGCGKFARDTDILRGWLVCDEEVRFKEEVAFLKKSSAKDF
jgi:hypothetical protein